MTGTDVLDTHQLDSLLGGRYSRDGRSVSKLWPAVS